MDNYKEDFLSKLNWMTPSKGSSISDKDVTFSILKPSNGRTRCGISFRNECFKKITSTNFYSLCFHKNRILFKEMEAGKGYKLTHRECDTNTYSTITVDDTAKAFIGDYDLKYDDFLELYYVEKGV